MTTPLRPDLFELVAAAVSDGVAAVYAWEHAGKYIGRYHEYPTITDGRDGFPWFWRTFILDNSAPLEYTSAFRHDAIDPRSIASFQRVVDFVRTDQVLSQYFYLGPEVPEQHRDPMLVFIKLEAMVERYIYQTEHAAFEHSLFLPIFLEWERSVLDENLEIEIIVPILNHRFSIDSFVVDDGLEVRRLEPAMQVARMAARHNSMNDSDEASKAATHAVVLTGWILPNQPAIFGHPLVAKASAYSDVLNRVSNFFAAMRVVSDCDTGYGQVVVRHLGWAHDWTAGLPVVSAFTVREHPDWRHGVRPDSEVFGEEHLNATASIYRSIASARTAKMQAAARRLNAAKVRSSERDSILDITIGLETLLTDDGRSEITYRLAMRMAALSRLIPLDGYSPVQVYRASKRLYDFRSAVAHGSSAAEKKRMVKLSTDQARPANAVGVTFLRHALRVLASFPALQAPERIDAKLLGLVDPHDSLD